MAARECIKPYIHETPLLTSETLDQMVGAKLFFKAEHLQKVGAFKARGAVNAVFSIPADETARGVATHSSGNHGAALARAAALRSIPAHIVVPENANALKVEAIRSYGGNITYCESTLEAREAMLTNTLKNTGALMVHPYDDWRVIAGQGTTALEVIEQFKSMGTSLDVFVAPVGGGGLLSGTAKVLSERSNAKVYGAEPAAADDAYRSFTSGIRVTTHEPHTIADGLRTCLGERNFQVIQEHVDGILLVTEKEIVDAMKLVWTRLKQIIEPSSAVTLAAAIRYPQLFADKNVCLVLTGGNVDPMHLPF